MCGRYTLHTNQNKLAEAIAHAMPEQFQPRYNIGPGSEVLVITKGAKNLLSAGMMQWGLRTPQNFHINARLESADTTLSRQLGATTLLNPSQWFFRVV